MSQLPRKEVQVRQLQQHNFSQIRLRLVAGEAGLGRSITSARIQKLGLALTGYTDYLHDGRVQFFGGTEAGYLQRLDLEARRRAIDFLRVHEISCFVVTRGLNAPAELLALAEEKTIPLFLTDALSSSAIAQVSDFLAEHLSPALTLHGALLDIYGLGVLLTGESGIGKSECALDLILRGHRLVSDDLVEIQRRAPDRLVGSGPENLRFHMEVRGLGVLNIKELFGVSALSLSKPVDMAVRFERWKVDQQKDNPLPYGRGTEDLGMDDDHLEILDVPIPLVRMPVAPGRNIATLVEVAARIHLLKMQGYNPARELDRRMKELLHPSGA